MTESTPTRLVLVRHGESLATVNEVVGGHQGCTGLSDLGRRQAAALRDRLARTGELAGAAVLVTSVLPRAIETADIIAPALGGLAVKQDCDVCEIHPGEGDALSWVEFSARYGQGQPRSRFEPMAPGAESWAVFMARTGRALLALAEEHAGRTAVVVCHGGVVEGSFASFGNLPIQRAFGLATENTSITEWELRPGRDLWWLVRFNDAAHLEGGLRP
ncbi:MAG: histidine phosphatase family protein [Acidimicrobiales bacterium]